MQQRLLFYKTDFKITEKSEVGYSVPFRFAFFASSPARTFVASFDGKKYTNCRLDDNGDLVIGFDNHNLGVGLLMVTRTYYLNDQDYAEGVCDETIAPAPVVIEEEDQYGVLQRFNIQLSLKGETTINATSTVAPYWTKGDKGDKGDDGDKGEQGDVGPAGGFLFPIMNFDPRAGVLAISGLEHEISRVRYDYTTAELIIRLVN